MGSSASEDGEESDGICDPEDDDVDAISSDDCTSGREQDCDILLRRRRYFHFFTDVKGDVVLG